MAVIINKIMGLYSVSIIILCITKLMNFGRKTSFIIEFVVILLQ